MRRTLFFSVALLVCLSITVGLAFAQKPQRDDVYIGNGFPSGPHYNLNIIGKNAEFTCPGDCDPAVELCGNVVFVPQIDVGIQLLMQSGANIGKKGPVLPVDELIAIDPCTKPFDLDAAIIQLPYNANGYRVYARALANPPAEMAITPSLSSAVDEFGNDLWELGLITGGGFQTPYQTVTRTKGKSTATDITGLFQWSGNVCYVTPPSSDYTPMCVDLDGVDPLNSPIPALGVPPACQDPYTLTYCMTYQPTWVFNIADFVEYLWSIDNNGSKLVQIRFYPN